MVDSGKCELDRIILTNCYEERHNEKVYRGWSSRTIFYVNLTYWTNWYFSVKRAIFYLDQQNSFSRFGLLDAVLLGKLPCTFYSSTMCQGRKIERNKLLRGYSEFHKDKDR